MTTFNYFAYGSNMLTTRMRERCESATINDKSGKATLKAAESSSTVMGVVFEIAENEANALHEAEGPGYACKHDFTVICLRTGAPISTRTYLAVDHDHTLKPYDWYLALVLAGIDEHKLGEDYAALYRTRTYDIDNDIRRRQRQIALKVLERAGIADFATLLTGTRS